MASRRRDRNSMAGRRGISYKPSLREAPISTLTPRAKRASGELGRAFKGSASQDYPLDPTTCYYPLYLVQGSAARDLLGGRLVPHEVALERGLLRKVCLEKQSQDVLIGRLNSTEF